MIKPIFLLIKKIFLEINHFFDKGIYFLLNWRENPSKVYFFLIRIKMRILLIIIRVQNLLSGQVDSLFPPPEIITHWKIENFKESGEKFVGYLIKACGLNPNEKVLDVGCGIGRMAIPLTKYLTSGSYDGFDIVESGIKWCREYITRRFPKFHFQKADIYNRAYNSMGNTRHPSIDFHIKMNPLILYFSHPYLYICSPKKWKITFLRLPAYSKVRVDA